MGSTFLNLIGITLRIFVNGKSYSTQIETYDGGKPSVEKWVFVVKNGRKQEMMIYLLMIYIWQKANSLNISL